MPKRIDREQRKAELAEAVWRVVRERGIAAVSVRSVAEEASVVVGSLRHVFPTRAELLEFSAELMVQRAGERIQAIPRGEDDSLYVLEVLTQLLPLEPESRAEMEVNIALIAEAPALPELMAIRDEAHRQLGEACVNYVELLLRRPRDAHIIQQARRLHAIIDGLAMHLLHSPSHDNDWAIDILRDELAHLTADTSA